MIPRARYYGLLAIGLGWWNMTMVEHWWPLLVFSLLALYFFLLSLDIPAPVTPKGDHGQFSLRILDRNGIPLSDPHAAYLVEGETTPMGHATVTYRAICLPERDAEVASGELLINGKKLLTFSMGDAGPCHQGEPYQLTLHQHFGESTCQDC